MLESFASIEARAEYWRSEAPFAPSLAVYGLSPAAAPGTER